MHGRKTQDGSCHATMCTLLGSWKMDDCKPGWKSAGCMEGCDAASLREHTMWGTLWRRAGGLCTSQTAQYTTTTIQVRQRGAQKASNCVCSSGGARSAPLSDRTMSRITAAKLPGCGCVFRGNCFTKRKL